MSADLTDFRDVESVGGADPLEAWTAVLDSLEAAIDEAVAGDPTDAALVPEIAALGTWTPPYAIGPLPEVLLKRARGINERQRSAAAQLAVELRTLRQHRSVMDSVQTATAPEQKSVYLDVTG